MKVSFCKMHGCGNDYIFFDCFETEIGSPESLAVSLSDRHTGIGGDGIVLILPSPVADAKMRMFNADGSEGGMCGNAIRCVAKYLYDKGIVRKPQINVETLSGIRKLKLSVKDGTVSSVEVDMGGPEMRPGKIPVALAGDSAIDKAVTIGGAEYRITCVSMGNPHAVVFCDNSDELDLSRVGPLFENDVMFPDRVNAGFVEVIGGSRLKMRVWERGSGETLACGTGACAAAVAAVLNGYCDMDSAITVLLPGGDLTIRYTGETVYMTGDCIKVFDGTIEL